MTLDERTAALVTQREQLQALYQRAVDAAKDASLRLLEIDAKLALLAQLTAEGG